MWFCEKQAFQFYVRKVEMSEDKNHHGFVRRTFLKL
jgi:hypothetical protein